MNKSFLLALAMVLVGQGCVWPWSSPNGASESTAQGSVDTEAAAMLEEGVAMFEISGTNFAFRPNTVVVKEGQKMRITFTSDEGFHDWTVDEFGAHTMRVNTGESAMVEFTPDQAGTFIFYSSVGDDRANGMVGTLIVEEVAQPVVETEAGGVLFEGDVDVEGELKL